MRHVIICGGAVTNAILWNPADPYELLEGCIMVQSDTLNIGEAYQPVQGEMVYTSEEQPNE